MNKRTLGILAIVLILLMAIVASAGLDNLRPGTRERASTAISEMVKAREEITSTRQTLQRTWQGEPALFHGVQAVWLERVNAAEQKLKRADAEAQRLRDLVEKNNRGDEEAVAAATAALDRERDSAMQELRSVNEQTKRLVTFKQRAPEMLREMEGRYASVAAFDPRTVAGVAAKAIADWPQKKGDLETRISGLENTKNRAQELWASTAADRTEALAGEWNAVDFAALANLDEVLRGATKDLPATAESINRLASQLYVGRDKVLLELDRDENPRQQVRVVETKYADASLANPQVSNTERWEPIKETRFRELEKAVGMVVERKPPGKYDSEAELTAQAPGYAYIAPPGQSNQYGAWNNGVWNWLPQYLILSQLLRGPSYPPVRYDDYSNYDRHRRRGDVWYGRYGRTWGGGGSVGTGGGLRGALERYAGRSSGSGSGVESSSRPRERWTWGGKSGGFGSSQYRSRGTFGGSRYGSGSSSRGFGSRSYSRGFGRRR